MLIFDMSFFEFYSAACCKKKACDKQAFQQGFGPSYFDRALSYITLKKIKSHQTWKSLTDLNLFNQINIIFHKEKCYDSLGSF